MKAQLDTSTEGTKPSVKKEQRNSSNKDRGKVKGNVGSDKIKPPKVTVPREPVKKLFRLVIRKLPARDFLEADVQQCLDRVCGSAGIGLSRDAFTVEHYVAGKISRKRGQVTSTAFVAVNDEVQYWRFLAHCPLKIPFIEGEEASAQPEITPAPNQKAFKQKDRNDKLLNTHETDPFFAAFTAKLSKAVDKLPSAEAQLDTKKDASAQSREELIKNNPLLKYMREKAEKKMLERRLLKRGSSSKSLQVSSVLTKSGSKSGSKSGGAASSGGKSGKERTRGGRDKNKDGKEGREGKDSGKPSSAAAGGVGAGDTAPNREGREPREPKEPRGRGGRGKVRDKESSAAGEGAAAPVVPKFTIAKRGDAPVSGAGGAAAVQGTGAGGASTSGGQSERKERPPRREKEHNRGSERVSEGGGAGTPNISGCTASEGPGSGVGRGGKGRGGGLSSGSAGRGDNGSRGEGGRSDGARGKGHGRESRGGQGQSQPEGHVRSGTAP